jgi:hypothetical protein
MNMQDKELDELFFSNLKDFEMQPSEDVWAGITHALDQKRERRIITSPVLKIAASIVVLVTAGLLFIPKQKEQQVQQGQNKLAVNQPAVEAVIRAHSDKQAPIVVTESTPVAQEQSKADVSRQAVKLIEENQRNEEITNVTATPTTEAQVMLAAQAAPEAALQAVVPETPLITNTLTDEAPVFKTKVPVLAQVTDKASKPEGKKHKIHNLGDLVNMVVSKVDKRQNKIIEFSETADEDSKVTGINLGLIKLTSEK